MDAVVNIKLSPREFDLVRTAIEDQADVMHGLFKSADLAASDRHTARATEAQLREILSKLQ